MHLRAGTTPLIFFSNYIAVKMEDKNPSGSIKDRIVESTLNYLRNEGLISVTSEVISILNGEFAVSFAYFCAKKGFKCNIIHSSTMNQKHLSLCKTFGAEMYPIDSLDYKDFLDMKNELLKTNKKLIYINFEDKESSNKVYNISFCQELKMQIQSNQKNIKNIFLFSDNDYLADSLKENFPNASMYSVDINNGFFNLNGRKKSVVDNLSLFVNDELNKKLFSGEMSVKLDKVLENIKDVAKKSGLIMDYKTSACYLVAKEYICFNNDVNLIIFYENGERYIDEVFSF